jgi:hypothetical protein
MPNGRVTTSISWFPEHERVMQIWRDQTGMGQSEIVRHVIEAVYTWRFRKTDFDWVLEEPAWRKIEGSNG